MQNFVIVKLAGAEGRMELVNTELIESAEKKDEGILVRFADGNSITVDCGSLEEFRKQVMYDDMSRMAHVLHEIYGIMRVRR